MTKIQHDVIFPFRLTFSKRMLDFNIDRMNCCIRMRSFGEEMLTSADFGKKYRHCRLVPWYTAAVCAKVKAIDGLH